MDSLCKQACLAWQEKWLAYKKIKIYENIPLLNIMSHIWLKLFKIMRYIDRLVDILV